MAEGRGVYRVVVGKPELEKNQWGDPGVDERIILRWMLRKLNVGIWTGLGWIKIGTGGGHL
jgi:hypothetical protein